ncbi:hypothetical protein TcasGA2_TC032483 [Tribolium castaneum]|uniref:Uncharacterized protein n=1 Tax=Tribolium castaneum TaxID=7070 RepID=A0A139WKW3_TRICA|nr:hypothetical protein TcasGA2_TC032483 [Tribolium castaneum]
MLAAFALTFDKYHLLGRLAGAIKSSGLLVTNHLIRISTMTGWRTWV